MNIRWPGLLLCYLSLLCSAAIADESSYLIRPHTFTMSNNTGRDFVFFLGTLGHELKRQDIPRDQIEAYSDGHSDSYIVKLPTAGHGSVSYSVYAGKRYQIYWNAETYHWDLAELRAR